MYKLIHGLRPPPLNQCVSFCRDNTRETRASATGDCSDKFRKTAFGQSAFAVRAAAHFPPISENAQALVFKKQHLKHGSRQINNVITDVNICMEPTNSETMFIVKHFCKTFYMWCTVCKYCKLLACKRFCFLIVIIQYVKCSCTVLFF